MLERVFLPFSLSRLSFAAMVIAIAAAALIVSACGGDDEPEPTPTVGRAHGGPADAGAPDGHTY